MTVDLAPLQQSLNGLDFVNYKARLKFRYYTTVKSVSNAWFIYEPGLKFNVNPGFHGFDFYSHLVDEVLDRIFSELAEEPPVVHYSDIDARLFDYIVELLKGRLFENYRRLFFVAATKMYIPKRRGIDWKDIRAMFTAFLIVSCFHLGYTYTKYLRNHNGRMDFENEIRQRVNDKPFSRYTLQNRVDSLNAVDQKAASTPFYPKIYVDEYEYYELVARCKEAKDEKEREQIMKVFWAKMGFGVWVGGGNLIDENLNLIEENARKLKRDTSIIMYLYTNNNDEVQCTRLKMDIYAAAKATDTIYVKVQKLP